MELNEILSLILNLISLGLMIATYFIKGNNMTKILVMVFIANISIAGGYALTGAYQGAVTCFICSFQAIINSRFDKKNIPVPKWLLAIYIASIITVNLWSASWQITFLSILAILASSAYVGCVASKNATMYRVFTLFNMGLWIVYDIFSKSYEALLNHSILLVFNIAGMILNDVKLKKAE